MVCGGMGNVRIGQKGFVVWEDRVSKKASVELDPEGELDLNHSCTETTVCCRNVVCL